MNTTEVIELCDELATTGNQHVISNMPNVEAIKPIKIVGQEIIPRVTDLLHNYSWKSLNAQQFNIQLVKNTPDIREDQPTMAA